MKQTKIEIKNMMCQACEKVVTKRLLGIAGVTEVKVNVKTGNAMVVSGNAIRKEEAEAALSGTHYQVAEVISE